MRNPFYNNNLYPSSIRQHDKKICYYRSIHYTRRMDMECCQVWFHCCLAQFEMILRTQSQIYGSRISIYNFQFGKMSGINQEATVELFDITGRILFQQKICSSSAIPLENCSGCCILRVKTKGKKEVVKKLIL